VIDSFVWNINKKYVYGMGLGRLKEILMPDVQAHPNFRPLVVQCCTCMVQVYLISGTLGLG
jgi:hypothetical protein